MVKKFLCLLLVILLASSTVFAIEKTVKTEIELDNPPKDIDWTSNSNDVVDWIGMDITVEGHHGRVESIDDTNKDGKVGYCDYVVINWINLNSRQPYWKYHCENGEYINDSQDPDYGRWKFEFDYKSKSKLAPKIDRNIYWVDDDNTAGPWDGSYYNPYKTIQDAVTELEISSPGGEIYDIYVKPGIYPNGIMTETFEGRIRGNIWSSGYFEEGVIVGGGNTHSSTVILRSDYCTLTGLTIIGNGENEEHAGIEIHSNNNTIIGCDIYNCINGIYILDSANNNLIIENKIHGCDFNFFVGSDPFDNRIYHNQLYDSNYFNAKDLGSNYWDDGESRGNYWDDYEGKDTDGDGIGDEPYLIQGNLNYDRYPIENKTKWPFNKDPYIGQIEGETEGTPGEKYGYAVKFYDDEYHDAVLKIDWGDGSNIEYSEYLGAEMEYVFEHNWSEEGTYNIKVRATDMLGGISEWETLEVTIPKNKSLTYVDFNKIIIFHHPIFDKILNHII